MAMTTEENSESKSDIKEPPFEKITFNTDYKIKTSIEEPFMDLELKPLPDNLKCVFLEGPSFFLVIISSQLSEENKNNLVNTDEIRKAIIGAVSLIHCVPKKGGITVVTNERNELVPTRTLTGWRVCIDYQKLNEATAKDHFPLPLMDQMCMLAIFHDMIKESVEVFMDDFSVFGSSFHHYLNNLDKMLNCCKYAHLVLNWEKCHFMVKEGIVLGQKVSEAGLKVNKAKINAGRPKHYYRIIHQARGRKSLKRGKVFNRETAKYGKIWFDEDVHDLRSVITEFPAIVFNDNSTSNETLSCKPTVSSLNDEIDFIILFDDSDDEDYMVVFDKNSFSYNIISSNDLKTDSENDNEKVNMPLFPSPEPSVSCIYDLDFFKDFENEFPAIVYNDALTSKSDFLTEPTLCSQHIDEFDLKHETSLSEYDEVEQNVLYFNDLFPFNIVYLKILKSNKGDDDNEIDMIQSSRGNENTQGSNKSLEEIHDKINKVFIMKFFVMELNMNIVAWNYLINGMLFNLIKNLYVPFGILFNLKWYYKDGDCARMLRRPRYGSSTREQRHQYLRYEGLQYIDADIADFKTRLDRIYKREVHRVQVFNFGGLPDLMAEGLSSRMLMEHRDAQGQIVFTSRSWRQLFDIRGPLVYKLLLKFFSTFRFEEAVLDLDTNGDLELQLGGVRRRWKREADPRQGGSECLLDQDLICGGFFGYTPLLSLIRDLILRLYHRLIACSIVGRSQAPKKVTVTDLFYLRGMDVGSVNVPYLLAMYLRFFASGRKQGAMISGVIDMSKLVRLQLCVELDDTWAWVPAGPARQEGDAGRVAEETLVAPGDGDEDEEMPQAVLPPPRTQGESITRLEEEVHGMRERCSVRQRTDGPSTSAASQQHDP
uniref:Retrovirus-related Pol polyprotein from transposon opus n=1 Tax=Tanacetum cinerariifolium TaxID=118510 RepID=A0A6L2JUK6_TANCI|nr:retrovirus-related Pol polyprotein from transposon opus [Tanacetum cinerariifolium]